MSTTNMVAVGKIIPIIAFILGIYTSITQAQDCAWLKDYNKTCINNIVCPTKEFQIDIWEDCDTDSWLFTQNGGITLTGNCFGIAFSLDENDPMNVLLQDSLDAEITKGKPINCRFAVDQDPPNGLYSTITTLDVDEFQPETSLGPVYTVNNFNETDVLKKEVLRFTIEDPDFNEASSIDMTNALDNQDNDDFEFMGTNIGNKKEFVIMNKNPIDFEKRTYYSLKYNIQSTDERGDTSGNVVQQVMVFVQDISDSPPFWETPVPSIILPECNAMTLAFKVTAQDRDVTIKNNITYSITEGNDGYFKIDPENGSVTTVKDIDREELETLSFALTIKATEVPGQASVNGEDSSTQVTNIYISDINDNKPTFDKEIYTFEMDELSGQESQDIDLDSLIIFVVDMDEGDNGTYSLTTSSVDLNRLEVSLPKNTGRGNSSVTLRAKDGGFDYETQENTPLVFTLTATEKANESHTSTVKIEITLCDINDNDPVFNQTNYTGSVYENATEGDLVLTVYATDGDKNETFGTPSIRYFFKNPSSCQELDINEETGGVRVSESGFDFEKDKKVTEVKCTVQARDSKGEGNYKSSDIQLTINVNDVPDGTPILQLNNKMEEVHENQTDPTVLCELMASDDNSDASAEIIFTIDWDNSKTNNQEYRDWFNISEVKEDGVNFTSEVIALHNKLDREVVVEMTLRILATDMASGKMDTKDLIFKILDENDCWPEFPSDFPQEVSILEYYSDKGCSDGDFITKINPLDADEDPQITFSISDSKYVEVNSTGHLTVKNASLINHENFNEFLVDLIIEDEGQHKNSQKLKVRVNDLNDNPPIFDMSICNQNYSVYENAANGTDFGATVIANDSDAGDFGRPLYRLLNLDINFRTPFIIDQETGLITTFNNTERFLDREETDFWNLVIQARDRCGGDLGCEVLQSDPYCMINVTVIDVNDCYPDNFKIVKIDNVVDKISVTESIKAGDDLGIEIRAKDDDKPNTVNSEITYTVGGIYSLEGEPFPSITLTAESLNRTNTETNYLEFYCRLTSGGDLKHLIGTYIVKIEATDGGGLLNTHNLTLEVTDANDYPPEFDFNIDQNPCTNSTEISMEENNVVGWLNCSTSTSDDLKFRMKDGDIDDDNRKVDVKILKNSTKPDNATQLDAFTIVKDPKYNDIYGIKVTEQINRESGAWYNLTIHAQDCVDCNQDEPKLTQVHYLMIRITNVFEFPPIFKDPSNNCGSNTTKCEQLVFIPENESADKDFLEAYDEDNISGTETQDVFYKIMAVVPNDGKINLKNENGIKKENAITADKLDREMTPSYTVIIDTYNDEPYKPIYPISEPQPNRLFLTIIVLDKYDNKPAFENNNNVTFGSFMPTDNQGDEVLTIEAIDVDLNETLHYTISGNFNWTESDPPQTSDSEPPFKFAETDPKLPREGKLLLNFNPKGQRGFCTFPITVTDEGSMMSVTEVKVFSITEDLQVPFYFRNTTNELQGIQNNLQASLSRIFDLACKIDNIEQPAGLLTRQESDGLNIVVIHFINETENIVVPKHNIERISTGEKASAINKAMESLDLELIAIGDSTIETPTDNSQLYMILLGLSLGVVSLVLILLGFAYHRSTTNLKRQVKALSATTFGSVSSEMNQIGVDSAPVPGSNKFSGEGANPMYNLEDFTIKEDDVSSVGSGDSVLVGVEDTEDFRNYGRGKGRAPQPPGKKSAPAAPFEGGLDNPAFTGRSIDQVSSAAPPSAFDSTTRTNPLLQLGEDKDLTDSLGDYQFTVTRRGSSDMEEDDHPGASALNSNFTFG